MANTAVIGLECVPGLPREVVVDAFRHDRVSWVLGEILHPEDVAFEHIARPRLLACQQQLTSVRFCRQVFRLVLFYPI